MQINADRLCLYGVPDDRLREELVNWLKADVRRAVCILHEEELKWEHDRLRAYRLGGLETESLLHEIAWEGVFLSWSYLGEHPLIEQLKATQRRVHLFASDFADRGLQVARNLLKNVSQMQEIYLARDMRDHFKGVPAIVCGAGPSLEKAKDQLKDRGLIFSGGAGLKVLEKWGIKAHFAGAIDPFPAVERLQLKEHLDVPLFFQSRVASDLLHGMRGPKIWVEPSGHFPLEQWAAEEMGLPGGTFDGGWNVATFLAALAVYLGCDPVVLVGVDLQGEYAGEAISGEGEKRDWAIAKEWLNRFMATHPQVHLWPYEIPHCTIDATLRAPLVRPMSCNETFMSSVARLGAPVNKDDFLTRFELEEEIAYQVWCKPVWDVWEHVFKREVAGALDINKWLFIRRMCSEL